MTLYDESGESETVGCPVCHASMDDGCEHVLAFADITFGEMPSGPIAERIDEIRDTVLKVFAEKIASERPVVFDNQHTEEMWGAFRKEGFSEPDECSLASVQFIEFVFALLDDAGGTELPGSLLMESGGHCTSAIRISFAKDPQSVVDEALRLLPGYFGEKKPKKRRRKSL